MVTLLKDVGKIGKLHDAKEFLFGNEELHPSLWLDAVQYSFSASGDIISLLHKNKLVILKIVEKIDKVIDYDIRYQGVVADINVESATCILSLSVALQQKSVGTSMIIKTSTWDCVAIGFSSGILKVYTETGVQLFEQIFHPGPIKHMKFCNPKVLQDELILVYSDIFVAVDGFSLYQCLRFCRMQQSRTAGSNAGNNLNISYKKWLLQDQKSTADIEFYGVQNTTPFQHLFQASLAGGSANYVSNAGHGPVYNYLAVGKDPMIAQYCPEEQSARPIMSEVVMSVATKLMSYIPGSSWLSGWTQASQEQQVSYEPAIGITKNICINDPRREITSVTASPKGNLAILADNFGRLLLLDVGSMILVNIWKGYRDAQCGWLPVPETLATEMEKPKCTLFLVLYARKRGILEVWCPYQHYRVAAFNVGKKGILISSMFGALGEGSLSSPLSLPSWRPAKYCCFFIQENGNIIDISVPFESCFGLEYMLTIEDNKILDKAHTILQSINGSVLSIEDENELEKVIFEMQLASNISSMILKIQQHPLIRTEFKLMLAKGLTNKQNLSKELRSQPQFAPLEHLCQTFISVANLYKCINDLWKNAILLSSSAKSPLLADIQEVVDLYFAKSTIESSFEPPDALSFHSMFCPSNQDSALTFTTSNTLRHSFIKFLMLPFLYTEDFSYAYELLVETGLSLSDIFTTFIETCLLLDIQVCSQEYQLQISKVIRSFLPKFNSAGQMWDYFFKTIKSHQNVCHGLVLTVYCQNVAVDALEFTEVKIEVPEEPMSTDSTAGSSDEQEWVALSPEHEKWYSTRQQLWDALQLQINTSVSCTVNSLLNSSSNTVTHIVANFIIDNSLAQNFIDWVERCRNHASDDGDGVDNSEVFDDTLSWLLNIVPWWPYQLDPTTISICLIECLIFRWSAVVEAEDPEKDVSHLVSAADILLSLKSVSVQQSLFNILWETVFSRKLMKLQTLIEKIGRQPKDRMCVKELSMSFETLVKFISISRHIIINIDISKNTDERFTIKQENVWMSESRYWLLHKCVQNTKSLNPDLVILHAQLVASLELIISLNIKNIRPSLLFHAKYASFFFGSLTTTAPLRISTTPDIETLHERMLKLSVKSSVGSDIVIVPYHTTWNSLITNLAVMWDCAVSIQSYIAVFLYSLGKFGEADEIVITSSHRQELGLQLLEVLLAQLEMLIFFDEASQKLYLPVLSPALATWLRSKKDPTVAVLDMKVVFQTFCSILTWLNDGDKSELVIRNSKELRANLFKLL